MAIARKHGRAACGLLLLMVMIPMVVSPPLRAAEKGQARRPPPPPEVIAKLPPDGGDEFNRLVFEKSPYLLQHARNPVDWYPWGEEAFALARREEKPIFLSVGYSTCHWCHVMEHESFEDEEVAALMNEHFISIKVDREERPDIDSVYMTVTQALTRGSAGWPNTVVMTPDGKPFFAGTYFPRTDRFGRPGMMQIVPKLAEAWKDQRETLQNNAARFTAELAKFTGAAPGARLDSGTLDQAYVELARRYDAQRGGFGNSRKFPMSHGLSFLLRYWKRTGEQDALDMVEKTLTAMRLGGLYDHVGFGTHRYSTDPAWLVPHFEKMLYDQALLAIANIEAYQVTGKTSYANTAREIFTYVLRDMTSPEGGFFSAEDADSEGEEGKFYIWSPQQIKDALGAEDGDLFNKVFNIQDGGNFLEESTRQKTGFNIPHQTEPLAAIAAGLEMDEPALRSRVDAMRTRLFETRDRRVHPLKDDKILTDWNGLMIAALARGGQALDEPAYVEAAAKAADFVLEKLRRDDGRLLKRYRQGEAGLPAHLEDYAFTVWGLLDLYEATFDVRYLREAVALNGVMIKHYWDEDRGGFFLSAGDGERLIVRNKEIYDGAIPSGNSVATLNLVRLARITANVDYEEKAAKMMTAFSAAVSRGPSNYCLLMIALDFMVGPSFEVVVAGGADRADTERMFQSLRRPFLPNKVVLFRPDGPDVPPITELAPFTEAQVSRNGAATAYVCEAQVCKRPTTDVQLMLTYLGSMQ